MRYHVDPDELRKLAGGLLDVQAALTGPPAVLPERTDRADRASAAVATALAEAESNWSQARRRLLSDLGHLTQATQVAAATYAVVEGTAGAPAGGARP